MKSNALSAPICETADLTRWTYAPEGRAPTRMPYYRMPEHVLLPHSEVGTRRFRRSRGLDRYRRCGFAAGNQEAATSEAIGQS